MLIRRRTGAGSRPHEKSNKCRAARRLTRQNSCIIEELAQVKFVLQRAPRKANAARKWEEGEGTTNSAGCAHSAGDQFSLGDNAVAAAYRKGASRYDVRIRDGRGHGKADVVREVV